MLILSRLDGEAVIIRCKCGQQVVVYLTEARNGRAKIGFEASMSTNIVRAEIDEGEQYASEN